MKVCETCFQDRKKTSENDVDVEGEVVVDTR